MNTNSSSNQSSNTAKTHIPFWYPLSAGGCLWRSVVFLLGIILLTLLFTILMKGCGGYNLPLGNDGDRTRNGDRSRDIDQNPNPGTEYIYEPSDTSIVSLPDTIPDFSHREKAPVVRDWNDSIPDVPELPKPIDNYIPPVDSTVIITDPTDPYGGQIVGDQINVFFNSDDVKNDIASFARQFKQLYPGPQYNVAYYNVEAGTMILTVPTDELVQIIGNLERNIIGVDFIAVTNDMMIENVTPTDPAFKGKHNSTYFNLIQAYDAWDITNGSPDVKVAIVDSYFDLTNPEIAERYVDAIHIPSKTRAVTPPNKIATNGNEYTTNSHGSHVAGIAIGAQNNGRGASGIAPECTWIPIALGDELTQFNIIEGVLYAIYHGADVVNLSIGRMFPDGLSDILPLEDQVEIIKKTGQSKARLWQYIGRIAAEHNCIIVTAAGNETLLMGMDAKNRATNIIKVEAVDQNGIKADFSNYGKVPEDSIDYSTVAAPGVSLWSVLPKTSIPFAKANGIATTTDGFAEMSGTSMAAPVVTGAVALLKSKNKNLTAEDIIDILKATARQTDTQHRIGPTIQIADALNATGGERLNFDDLMNNHDLLIGKWKSTHELTLTNSEGVNIDKLWTYFTFTSTSEGILEQYAIGAKKTYTAKLRVTWGKNNIQITQLGDALAPDGDAINKDEFICQPNKDHLLETQCCRNGRERYSFLLEKVK